MQNKPNVALTEPHNHQDELKNQPSFFDGKLIALIGINLLTSFVNFITLGFAYPAMYALKSAGYIHTPLLTATA